MRRYYLTSAAARRSVDLRDFADVITNAVTTTMTGVDITVVVEKDSYIVSPAPSRGQAIKIGRLICRSKLNKYCVQIPKLFTGFDVETKKEELDESRAEQKTNHGVG